MYVDIRATYVAQTYLPLVHNFYPYTEQQPTMGLHHIPLLVCTPHNSCLRSSPAEARLKNNATLGRQSRGWRTNSAYYHHKVRARKAESPIAYSSSMASCRAPQSKLIIFFSCSAHADCLHSFAATPGFSVLRNLSIISPIFRSFRLPFCTIPL